MSTDFQPKNFTCTLLHYVWGSREQSMVLQQEGMRQLLYQTIHQIGKEQGFRIHFVNGHTDHLHLIVELGKNQKVARIAHTIQDMTETYFKQEFGLELGWHKTFLAVSIARKELPELTEQIMNHKSFKEEYVEIMHNYQ